MSTVPRGPARTRAGAVLAVLGLAQFMLVLDISVTNVALASIRTDLGFVVADLHWTITAYTLVLGSLLIFFGRAGDLWGRRRLFLVGVAVFTLASLACGLAQRPWHLIVARVVQGLGAAMMSPAALSLLTTAFAEGPARNRALGVWGAIAAGGAAGGMIIGGVLTDVLGWRWAFLINVPVGLAVIAVAPRIVAESRSTHRRRPDATSALSLTAGLVALVYGLTRIDDGDGPAAAIGWLGAAVVLLVVFTLAQRRSPEPLIDPALLGNRSVAAANAFSLLSTAVVVAQSFFIALYLREVLGYTPLRTGLALVPVTGVVLVVAAAVPRVLPRLGIRTVLIGAAVILAAGMALHARTPADGGYLPDVLPALLVTAAGLGLGMVAATIAATSGVPTDQQGLASGLLNTAQQLGGALGLATLATLAAARTDDLLLLGDTPPAALAGGFRLGFAAAAAVALLAAALVAAGLRHPAPGRSPTGPAHR